MTPPAQRHLLTNSVAPVLLLVATFSGIGLAQGPPKRSDSPPPAEQGRIRVTVNLVSVLASVTNGQGRPVPDLSREAFELFEEGVRQKIEVFESETQLPLDLALMIDGSLSTLKELPFEREAAAHFIRQVVRPGDRLSVYEFADSVTQLTGFSSDVPTLQAAARRIEPGAGTVLYDAVYLGARALGKLPVGRRRVIVLVTDAGETTSRVDFDAARRAALEAEALLYTILIRPVKSESGRNTAGEHALVTITDSTGGAMYYPEDVTELDATFDRIDRELRTQYRLSYYPEPRPPEGSLRRIEVRVKPPETEKDKGEYLVHHRKLYLTSGPP